MKILGTRFLVMVSALLVIGLGFGHWYASDLEASHPNGMWIYTPPANHVGPAPPAYPIGFDLVVFVVGVLTLMPSTTFWIVTRFWLRSKRQLATEILVSSIVCCLVFLAASAIVEFEYSKKMQCDSTGLTNDC